MTVMYSNSIHGHALKGWNTVAAILWGLAFALPAGAGQYQLLAGEPNSVVVAARVLNAEQICNLEVTVQGQTSIEREVKAPHFETRIDITPRETENVTVSWRGKFKRSNGELINACPTEGQTSFRVVVDNAPLRAAWASLWSQMRPEKAECVRTALQSDRVRYDWFDLSDPQTSAEDWKIQRAMAQCDAFLDRKKAWGDNKPDNFACSLPGGLKTRCEGYFMAIENGKNQPISKDAALRRQLDNLAWGTGVRETAAAQASRQRQAQALKAKLAAEEAAKIKAIEDARIREEQQALEAKAAQEQARKDKAEADRAKRLQEIERLENERLEKRSWLLKQLEKLKSDPKEESKSDNKDGKDGKGDSKPDGKGDGKTDAKPDGKAVNKEVTKEGSAKPQEAKPEEPKSK